MGYFSSRSEGQVDNLMNVLSDIKKFLLEGSTNAAAAVLAHGLTHAVLLHLTAVAVRLPPDVERSSAGREGARLKALAALILDVTGEVVRRAVNWGSTRPLPRRFLRYLLRTQTLQACSRQLAAAAADAVLPSEAMPGGAQEHAQGQGQQQGNRLVDFKFTLSIVTLACSIAISATTVMSKSTDAPQHEEAQELYRDFAAALSDSGVQEHAARVLLLLLLAPTAAAFHDNDAETICYMADLAAGIVTCLKSQTAYWDRPGSPVAQEALTQVRAALSGRCVRHPAVSLGLAALCTADGGPAYGMPPELLAVLKLGVGGVGADHAQRRISGTKLLPMLNSLAAESPAVRPPGWRASLALALRTARLAVASAQAAAAAEEAGQPSNSSGASGGAVLCPSDIVEVVTASLSAARQLLQSHALSPHWASGVAEWWRLAVAALLHTLPYAAKDLQALGDCLAWMGDAERKGVLCLPPEPPPLLAAALAGGLLPCLELMLRRAGRAPEGPEAVVLCRLLSSSGESPWVLLAPLLAYGDPRAGAALVATAAKLLRQTDPRVVAAEAAGPGLYTKSVLDMVTAFLTVMASPPGAPLDGGPSAASLQLVRLLSYAVGEWLPPLSLFVRRAAAEGGCTGIGSDVAVTLTSVLSWVSLLARQCTGADSGGLQGGEANGGAGGGAAGPSKASRGDGDSGCWQRLVLEEVGVVPLLELADKIHELAAWDVARMTLMYYRLVARSCLAVAELVHMREVRRQSGCVLTAEWPSEPPEHAIGAAATEAGAAAGCAGGKAVCGGDGDSGDCSGAASALERLALLAATIRDRLAGNAAPTIADVAVAQAAGSPQPERSDSESEPDAGSMGSRLQSIRRLLAPWVRASVLPEDLGALTRALVPPSEARRLLPTCANPACVNLEGDSEAGLTLRGCSGCGAVGYCCRACQTAHWRAGHREACKRRGGE